MYRPSTGSCKFKTACLDEDMVMVDSSDPVADWETYYRPCPKEEKMEEQSTWLNYIYQSTERPVLDAGDMLPDGHYNDKEYDVFQCESACDTHAECQSFTYGKSR